MIGMFDSGVGGLSILRHVRSQLPDRAIWYVADQAYAPYGDRSLEWVRARSHAVAETLLRLGAEVIVVACNTASAAALHSLRAAFPDVPFVGMEPAVKPAAETTERGVVGVLATRATFQGELYASVIDRHGAGVGVVERVGTGLVELVEAGLLEGPETSSILEQHLRPMLTAGVDTVVLGCTHYPFLAPAMRTILGPDVRLIDPAPAVARQTVRVLGTTGSPAGSPVIADAATRFFTTGDVTRFSGQIDTLLGGAADVESIAVAESLPT